jgi:hypothetical protein
MDAKMKTSIVQFLARLMIPTGSDEYFSKFVNLKHGRELKEGASSYYSVGIMVWAEELLIEKLLCVYQRKRIHPQYPIHVVFWATCSIIVFVEKCLMKQSSFVGMIGFGVVL